MKIAGNLPTHAKISTDCFLCALNNVLILASHKLLMLNLSHTHAHRVEDANAEKSSKLLELS